MVKTSQTQRERLEADTVGLKLENGALTQVMWVTSMFWKSLDKILL